MVRGVRVVGDLVVHVQVLHFPLRPFRNHEPASNIQLFHQGHGQTRRRGAHMDAVVRRMRRQTQAPVSVNLQTPGGGRRHFRTISVQGSINCPSGDQEGDKQGTHTVTAQDLAPLSPPITSSLQHKRKKKNTAHCQLANPTPTRLHSPS
jgi:hypothetical protein